ncbi:unnamed protein product [Tilletia controversa]|uniref:Dihydrolipoamide acetyltransferase component of pyruvate dehydrogenase complex n=3 Tax=Tilletia TaxID=13289 RepID=A0A8X7MSZ0_9BASI|nr:hypothetical protein CF336_g1395 [Tilletia laevis]KAE8202304.1 hypothetical protein CF328_g2287 [Tilletia controversa]KAE8264304.1 hypothetical protein A4X03_0g1048 [Tilletia caries]KAE8206639.1 hypothetical protein CF335_g1731 [Tilletia laevis]KAE8247727.1 hypothetical protein A4X06_0g4235 [Tilletia controversa]
MLACCCSSSSATRPAAAAAVFVLRPWTRRALTTNTLVAARSPQRHHHQPASTAARARARAPVLSSTLAASRSFQHAARFSTSALRRAPAPQPFLLADIGEGIQEVEIIKFMAKEGDRVEEFDPICEVQSDKATVEITSRFTGTISSLTHKVGDIVKVGSPICFIQKDGTDTAADAESPKATSQPQVDTRPTPAPETAPSAPKSDPVVNPSPSRPSFADLRPGQDILATPAVRRLSRDHTVDLAHVQGTGKDGRITKEDVQRHLDGGSGSSGSVRGGGNGQADASREAVSSSAASAESVPLDPIRRAMFKAMSNTLQIPHFAYSEEIDVTALEGLRKTISRSLAASASKNTDQQGEPTKLTMLPLLVKALSLALHDHPLFLSTLEIPRVNPTNGSPTSPSEQANGAKLTRRTSHDISIALSSPQGLLTPLLRSVHSRSILDLAVQIADLQSRAMVPAKQAGGGGLTPADFGGGGTITLSNIGAVGGGTYTHPLIPPTGQLAIGALGRTRAMPRFAGECPQDGLGELSSSENAGGREDPDRILKRLIMPVSFTGDHRVVEGAEMARLVQRWKTLVEQPSLWFTMLK